MAKTNPLKDLAERITQRLPNVTCEFDLSENERGSSFLDLIVNQKAAAVIEFKPGKGYGVSFPPNLEHDYGMGPSEVFGDNVHSLVERVTALLK